MARPQKRTNTLSAQKGSVCSINLVSVMGYYGDQMGMGSGVAPARRKGKPPWEGLNSTMKPLGFMLLDAHSFILSLCIT